jgi:hypothetical protein
MNSRELTQTDKIAILVIGLVGALMFLPGIILGLMIYTAADRLKNKKWMVYAAVAAAVTLVILTVKDFNMLILDYFKLILETYKSLFNSKIPHNLDWIVLIKVGIPVGFTLSLMMELYTAAQPEWVKKKKKIGKDKERSFNERLVKKLEKLSQPDDGTLIGIDEAGNTVKITDEELNGHCLVLGATGAGKTTTLMNFIESAARRGIPVHSVKLS